MASPEVWADARPRVQAVATALGLIVQWPNEETEEPEAGPDGGLPQFLAVHIEADGAEPYELGAGIWQETGTLWVHVLVPSGTGIEQGIETRKTMADAFRGLPGGPLRWFAFSFPPGGRDEGSGNWYRLSLGISYGFTDA